jgi:protein-S-isoprenylcysteine O-methyltransferase Ste14
MWFGSFQALCALTLVLATWVGVELWIGRRARSAGLKSTSPASEALISASTLVALAASVLSASSLPGARMSFPGAAIVVGVAMMLGGLGVRALAAHTLGSSYTLQVGVRQGQSICTGGPYRWIRHPGYVGTLIALLGFGLALASWWSLISILVVVPALAMRIASEERLLMDVFPDAYGNYCRQTRWRLVPGLL